MLNIRVNSEPIDLSADQGFEVVSTNPVIDKDRISRAFSFPFGIPATPKNSKIRQHPHRLDSSKVRGHDAGIVEFGGHQLLTGEVKTSSTANEGEEAFIQNIPLDVWEQLKAFKISEILETIDVDVSTGYMAVWWFTAQTPPNLYQIIIDGEVFVYDSLPGDDTFDVVTAMATLINATYPDMATAQATTALLLDAAQINDHPIQIDATLHFLSLNSVVTAGELSMRKMMNHVEDVFATPATTHCFPVIRWHDLYPSGGNTLFSNWVNMAIDGVAFENFKDTDRRWPNTFIPMVRVPYILEKIRTQIGAVGWIGDVFESEAIQQLIVVSNYCLDKLFYDRFDDVDHTNEFGYINGFELSWSLNACVPDMSAADFIREICGLYALTLDYGDGSLAFLKSKVAADKPPVNLNGKAAKRYKIAKNPLNGWVLKYQDSLLEKYADAGQLNAVAVGDSDVKIEIPRTFFMTSDYASSLGGHLKVPITQQAGAARVFSSNAARTTLPLTFLLERGQQSAELGNQYIYATHDTTDYDGAEIGDVALSIEGDKGLISVWHAGIIEFTDGDMLSITAVLSLGDIQKMMAWKTARATFYNPAGQVTGIVKSMRAKMAGNVIDPVAIEIVIKRS